MEAIFVKLVNMSITASWLVLAIIAVRFLFKKTPKWILCLLWGLVALRLICPFSIESALSLIPSAEPLPRDIIYTAHPEIHSGIPVVDDTVNPILESSMTPSELVSINPTQVWSFVFTQVWILGLVIMLAYALSSYLLLKRKVATAMPLRKNIKRCEFIDSPFVLGFFFPEIYLPAILEKKDWEYVIAHEEAHIQRRDHWWKPIGFGLLSIYWFNPILWLAYILLCRDIEAACDEKVIRNMDKDALRAYSTALLKSSIHQRAVTACPLAFGEVGIKERIRYVMNYRKPSFWIVLLSVILILIISVTLMTDPQKEYDPEKVYPQSVLQEPDRIYIDVNGTDRVFEKDSAVYRSLLEAFRVNWWKYNEEGLDTASYSDLVAPIAPEVLKTKSWRTYVDISDTIICFQYTENPIIWENAKGEEICIQTIGFVLPEKSWSEDNTKGFFLISKTDEIGTNEGIYTYYYPSEIANDFWDFIQNAKLNQVTKVPGRMLTLDGVINQSLKKDKLTLADFSGFAYEEQGDTMLFSRKYPINEAWYLLIHHGGGLEKPISIWLTNAYTGKYIDITQGNEDGAISAFIEEQEENERVYTWFDRDASNAENRWSRNDHPSLPGAEGVTLQHSSRRDAIELSPAPGARYKAVISGQFIRSVFLTDLTGDGISEICAAVTVADGNQVHIYDHAAQQLYRMDNPQGQYAFLTKRWDHLLILQQDAATGFTVDYGQLTLENGKPGIREIPAELKPLTQTINCVDVFTRKQVCLAKPEQIQQILTLLRELEGNLEPVPKTVLEGYQKDSFNQRYIDINYGLGETVLLFSKDYQVVWECGKQEGYRIRDPEPLRIYMESMTDGVTDRDVTGTKFAAKEEPWDWCSGIHLNAVVSAQAYICKYEDSGRTVSTNGILSADAVQRLLSLLNKLPKEAFSPGKTVSKEAYHTILTDLNSGNSSIAIRDGVNSLAAVIRTNGDKIELLLTDELDKVGMDNFTYLEPTQLWEIRDEALMAFFLELTEYMPVIHYTVGAEYEWQEPITFAYKDFLFDLRLIEDWEYMYVNNPTDSGIRCRPKGIIDGWIYFSFWPNGYAPAEENRYYAEGSTWGYDTITSYPSTVKSKTGVDTRHTVWSFRSVKMNQGDYVVINDGADAWFLEYEDQIEDTFTLADFAENK